MTDNIVYQSSAGVSGLHTESTEIVDHTYEKFYCDFEEKTKTKDNDNEKIGQRIDHGYVNENLSPKGIKEQVMDETKIIDQEDDDYYYENIDLSSKRTR